jgi:hypothetical protein
MGTTLWVLGKQSTADGDDYDHSAMFDAADDLDRMCEELGVARLSSFFDWSDFNANMGEDGADDVPPAWHDAGQAVAVLQALRKCVAERTGRPDQEQLEEELDDCLAKLARLADRSEAFHFCVVM